MWGEKLNALGEKGHETSPHWPVPGWLEEILRKADLYNMFERFLNSPPADWYSDPKTAGMQLQLEGFITIVTELRKVGLI